MEQGSTKATGYQAVAKPVGKTIDGTDKRDWLFGANGNDEIHGLGGDDAIFGLGGNDTLHGGLGNDKLYGGLGDDVLDGGAGLDQMAGGSGNDTYMVDDAGDTVTESRNRGIDMAQSSIDYTLGANVENLTLIEDSGAVTGTGNALDNRLYGNSGDNNLIGLKGNDFLDGGAGLDKMEGGPGNDTYVVDDEGDVIVENAGEGIDTVKASITYTLGDNAENLVFAGDEAINGTGNALNNAIYGNSADNALYGDAGNDSLSGGEGGDFIEGGEGDDNLWGDDGNDTLYGDDGKDVIDGGLGDDAVYGGEGDDRLYGGEGGDFLDGGAGLDQMAGGSGNDTYVVDNATDILTEKVNEGIDTVQSSFTYTLGDNFENLVLTGDTAINGTGNALDNTITGNSAANALNGGAGNDTYIFALGAGNDSITDAGADDKTSDRVLFESTVHKETIALFQSGNDIVIGYAETDTVTVVNQTSADSGIEKVQLSDGLFLTNADIAKVIEDITKFAADHGITLNTVNDVKSNEDLMNIINGAWHE